MTNQLFTRRNSRRCLHRYSPLCRFLLDVSSVEIRLSAGAGSTAISRAPASEGIPPAHTGTTIRARSSTSTSTSRPDATSMTTRKPQPIKCGFSRAPSSRWRSDGLITAAANRFSRSRKDHLETLTIFCRAPADVPSTAHALPLFSLARRRNRLPYRALQITGDVPGPAPLAVWIRGDRWRSSFARRSR